VSLPSKAAAIRLQLEAETYGIEFNDHYLRNNGDGSVTVSVFGTEEQVEELADAGYEIGVTIEGPNTWRRQVEARQTAIRKETRAAVAATGKPTQSEVPDKEAEIVVLRADYFENYAGRFLSVEAKTREAAIDPATGAYTGPTLSLAWNEGDGTAIASTPRPMNVNIDPDTTPDTYIEHRELVRIGGASSADDVGTPTRIRIGSSTGEAMEADVEPWLDGGLPPMTPGRLSDFTTRYLDPTEVYQRFDDLAAEFPNLAQMIDLPNQTNGYQRRAQATMEGTAFNPGNSFPNNAAGQAAATRAVVLTSRAWGHEGGNAITAAFTNPGVASSPLSVTVSGNDLTVSLATDAAGALSSTAAQVAAAINAAPEASALLVARTYRNNAGAGIVQARARVNLSDFLSTATNAHVQRGPFQYSVMRIGKRDPDSVGVFLYCQEHAREWATPLTCLETAEQLLRNYAIDPATKRLVDNLDIFILPSSNPDGAHYSMHNFGQQRKNLTTWCTEGGEETTTRSVPPSGRRG
jgi:acylphosphatase